MAVVGSLSQVLHLLDGHYTDKCTTGRTFEEHYDELGLHRFTKVTKTGKVTKKGYTPNMLSEAVNSGLRTANGGYRYFKNVPVMFVDFATMKSTKVYDETNADKLCAYKNNESQDNKVKNVTIYRRTNIEADGFTWKLVDTLLEQSDNVNGGAAFNKAVKKETESHKAYKAISALYVVVFNDLTGKWEKKEVSKDECLGADDAILKGLDAAESTAKVDVTTKVDVDVTPAVEKAEKTA